MGVVIELRPTTRTVERELFAVSSVADWYAEVSSAEDGTPYAVVTSRTHGTEYSLHWGPGGWAALDANLCVVARAPRLSDALRSAGEQH